jgi:hypothetical protein
MLGSNVATEPQLVPVMMMTMTMRIAVVKNNSNSSDNINNINSSRNDKNKNTQTVGQHVVDDLPVDHAADVWATRGEAKYAATRA